jgi:chromosome segregation ATPase
VNNVSTVSDKIQKLSEGIGPLKDKLKAQMAEAEDLQKKLETDADDETLPEMLSTVSDEIESTRKELEKMEAQRDSMKKFEQTMAGGSQPATKSATPIRKRSNSNDEQPGRIFAKMSLAEAIGKIKGIPAPSVINEMYADDERVKAVHGLVTKTAVIQADTTTTGYFA